MSAEPASLRVREPVERSPARGCHHVRATGHSLWSIPQMPTFRHIAIVAIVAIAGCGAPVSSGPPRSPTISCLGVPADRCDAAVASAARSLPNTVLVSIEVSCVSGTCTRQSGAMDTVVTLADGSQLRSTTLSWMDPGDEPLNANGSAAPSALASQDVPPAVPEVPVEPICQGVPASICRTMAETAFGELSDEGVVQIVVRCTRPPCTAGHGTGSTVVTYADGIRRTSDWEYQGG